MRKANMTPQERLRPSHSNTTGLGGASHPRGTTDPRKRLGVSQRQPGVLLKGKKIPGDPHGLRGLRPMEGKRVRVGGRGTASLWPHLGTP